MPGDDVVVRYPNRGDTNSGQPLGEAGQPVFPWRGRITCSPAAGVAGSPDKTAGVEDREAQVRTPISDGLGKPWVFRFKDLRSWWSNPHFNRPGGTESGAAWVPESKPIRFTEAGCPAIDKGANQPNVFFDPKSSESFAPYFSRGFPDDLIQRRYIEALHTYWADTDHNPTSGFFRGG